MKKILAVICFSFLSLSTANSEILSLGVQGNIGLLSALGKETITGTSETNVVWGATSAAARTAGVASTSSTKETRDIMIGYASLFAEGHLANTGLRLGVSYVPYPLESETSDNARHDNCSTNESHLQTSEATTTTDNNTCTRTVNTIQVDLEDLISTYVAYHHKIDTQFVNSFFIKAGFLQADVITKEKLTSGSSYGNTTLKGEFFGLGVEKNIESAGLFVRLEGSVTQFDSLKLKNTGSGSDNTNTIDITGLDGATATISIGKSF
tara:strand:+ start:977 stop:1774 length:798 start_codon:yes stop_codon:yes gene_type:complete